MAKSEFLSNMSHELRTPLNGILGFADILYDDESDSQKKDFLKIIKDSGAHLLTIINDILDISKIEAGMFRISNEPFDIKQSIKWIEDNFKEAIKIKGNKLTLVDNSKSKILYGDELRIKQILTNLISNSNKFTESGEIRVEISEKNIDCGRVEVNFVVEDTGIGISEKKMKNLFQMFDQGERHLTKKYGGTGIGLAVVKKLTDLMNGEIFVKSEIGKGSLFEIKIPLQLSEMKPDKLAHESDAHEADSPEDLDLSKYKILVADDCEINVLFIKMLLEATGAKFDIVSDGNEVINIVKNNRYDLILMDSQMPNINGLEATKIIRNMEDKTIADIPIIALSAYALNEDIQKAFSYGINDYLSKPYEKAF
ncbi:MAG TPA: ATP-binding protein, partial [Spirochaetota bacterium]|nr:ATP-binding protein [Spirochaetota bacterium]